MDRQTFETLFMLEPEGFIRLAFEILPFSITLNVFTGGDHVPQTILVSDIEGLVGLARFPGVSDKVIEPVWGRLNSIWSFQRNLDGCRDI